MDVGPTASAGRKSLRPQVPSAAGAFGRKSLRPQVPSAARAFGRKSLRPQEPSAGPTAFSNATSCPAPCQSCVRSRSAVGSGRCMLVGCPLDLLFASSASGCSRPVFSCSCQHAGMQSSQSTVQVQRLYTRSPGTLAHRHAPRHTSTQAAVVSFPSHSHHIPITSLPRMPVPE